jgi:nickel transport protein
MQSGFRLLLLGATCLVPHAFAHTVWIEPVGESPGEYRVLFGGHAGKLEKYDAQKLKSVTATDAAGRELVVTRSVTPEGVRLRVQGTPAMVLIHFDNGIHTRSASGPSVEKPMNEVPGATRATYAVKYHKTLFEWTPHTTRPAGQPFEVVPLDRMPPVAGKPLRVQVLQDGKPVPGVRLGRGEEGTATDPVTDAEGIAAFVPDAGFNRLWAGKRIPVSGNPRYTELSYEYLFAFDAR